MSMISELETQNQNQKANESYKTIMALDTSMPATTSMRVMLEDRYNPAGLAGVIGPNANEEKTSESNCMIENGHQREISSPIKWANAEETSNLTQGEKFQRDTQQKQHAWFNVCFRGVADLVGWFTFGGSKLLISLFESLFFLVEVNHSTADFAQLPTAQVHAVQWSPPPVGVVKINCDASVRLGAAGGIGFIARDSSGEVWFYGAKTTQDSTNIELVEAEALLWAMEVCRDQELSHVCFKFDCLATISRLRNANDWRGSVGALLSRLRSLQSGFAASCPVRGLIPDGLQMRLHTIWPHSALLFLCYVYFLLVFLFLWKRFYALICQFNWRWFCCSMHV